MDTIWICAVITLIQFPQVISHGRLMNPPGRNAMWRFGYPTPCNYNDNELFCGGYSVHQDVNKGLCGLCGDDYRLEAPRPHETDGKFGRAVISRRYYSGQLIDVSIDLTSNHMGYFVFFICPVRDSVERDCRGQFHFERNTLPIVYGNGTLAKKYVIESREKSMSIGVTLALPRALNCSWCSLQWVYVTGNSWGVCDDGTEAVGCGKQETFINCADISIYPLSYYYANSRFWLDPRLTSSSRANPYTKYYRDVTKANAPMTALIVRFQRCVATRNNPPPGMDDNCQKSCLSYPPECPPETCKCVKDAYAIGEFSKKPMADQWCLDQCNVYLEASSNKCDPTKCHVIYTSAQVAQQYY